MAAKSPVERPTIKEIGTLENISAVEADHQFLGKRYLYFEGKAPLLFTENESNYQRLFGGINATPYVKDGINNYIVNKDTNAVNPAKVGTKVSANYQLDSSCQPIKN